MYNLNDALYVQKTLGLKLDKFSIYDLLNGMNIESEHGLINPDTNITNDDIIKTSKIALAHLNEFPNYYNEQYGLKRFEEFLKRKL